MQVDESLGVPRNCIPSCSNYNCTQKVLRTSIFWGVGGGLFVVSYIGEEIRELNYQPWTGSH